MFESDRFWKVMCIIVFLTVVAVFVGMALDLSKREKDKRDPGSAINEPSNEVDFGEREFSGHRWVWAQQSHSWDAGFHFVHHPDCCTAKGK